MKTLTLFLAVLPAVMHSGCELPEEIVVHPELTRTHYTRVNFRPDRGHLLRDCNFFILPSQISIGATVKITHYSRREAKLEIDGVTHRLVPYSQPFLPTEPASIEAFLHKYFVSSTEFLKTDVLGPPEYTASVRAGQPVIGMTKEQVYACLGPPLKIGGGKCGLELTYDEILAADTWYHGHQIILVPILTTYTFGDGRLQRIGQ